MEGGYKDWEIKLYRTGVGLDLNPVTRVADERGAGDPPYQNPIGLLP